MIQALARLLGMQVIGRLLDQLDPRRAAWLRAAVVLVANAAPILLMARHDISYGDALTWLWVDAFVVGIWTIVTFVARHAPVSTTRFFVIHYFLMFTLLPGVIGYALYLREISPLTGSGLFVIVFTVVSFVLHGYVTRSEWFTDPQPVRGSGMVLAVVPYVRLAVVYVGLFLPLAVPGVPSDDPRPVDVHALAVAGVGLLALKLVVELGMVLVRNRLAAGFAASTERSAGG